MKNKIVLSMTMLLLLLPYQVYAGSLLGFLGGASLAPAFQEFDYEGKSTEPDTETGFGVLLDLGQRHALAIDYYVLTERFEETDRSYDVEDRVNALFLGYRFHSRSGFRIGAGLAHLSVTSITADLEVPTLTETIVSDLEAIFEPVSVPAITLGYTYSFGTGFSLGAHLLRVVETDLKLDEVRYDGQTFLTDSGLELNDFYFQTVGFLIGYTW